MVATSFPSFAIPAVVAPHANGNQAIKVAVPRLAPAILGNLVLRRGHLAKVQPVSVVTPVLGANPVIDTLRLAIVVPAVGETSAAAAGPGTCAFVCEGRCGEEKRDEFEVHCEGESRCVSRCF